MSSVKTVRLPKNLSKAILHRVKTEKVDESTAIRQLLALGVEDYAAKLYQEGRITLGEAAALNRRESKRNDRYIARTRSTRQHQARSAAESPRFHNETLGLTSATPNRSRAHCSFHL